MGNIGSFRRHVNITSEWRGHQAKTGTRIYSLSATDWQRIALDSLTRTYRTPRVLDEVVALRGHLVIQF
jgi:hypothetical protein